MAKKKTRAQHFIEEQLKDPDVAKSFSEGLEALRLSVQIAQLREQRGLTQTELAARMHTSAPVISRLESGSACTLQTLQKVAEALEAILKIELVPREKWEPSSKAA